MVDSRRTIANALSAHSAGEIFILTPERQIIYRGPVYQSSGYLSRIFKPRANYISDVLLALISDKIVIEQFPRVIPVSDCSILHPVHKEKLFYSDVAPIIRNKCSVCHNSSGSSPVSYMSYEDVVGRRAMFRYVIENDLMPPWNLDPNTGPWEDSFLLTSTEKFMLLKWIDSGYPRRSEAKDTLLTWEYSASPEQKDTPDYVLSLPETVKIPAGSVAYKKFLIKTDFKEDKWVRHVKFVSKPKAIHHNIIKIMDHYYDPSDPDRSSSFKYMLNKLDSGARKILSDDVGIKIPKKAKLFWEIHYEPYGKEVIDNLTHVQIFFYKRKPKYQTFRLELDSKTFNIPPHASNFKTTVSYVTEEDLYIASIGPHMHLRGKASSVIVVSPKGMRKRIFGLAPYLWNFERSFKFKSPLFIAKGSILECNNWFDNSVNNKSNPAPQKYVTFGRYLTDEMSDCFIRVIYPSDSSGKYRIITQ